jgi:flotillin
MISVQEQEVLRKEKELEANVVKQAEADRRAAVLRAQGLQEAAILEAEGRKQALIATAEAEAQKLQREGQGRASAVEAEGKAEAERVRAVGLAEAEKLQAQGLAQAKAIEAQGLAEATAIKEKAAAWREFNDAARLQTILEKLPAIIESSAPVFSAVSEPLGKIDKVVMIDQGGGNGNGDHTSGINRFAQTGPTVIFGLLQEIMAQLTNETNGKPPEKSVTPVSEEPKE